VSVLDHILASLRDDASVRDLRVCVRATAVWSRRLGLAYTFPRVHRGHAAEPRREPRRLSDLSARQLCELARSDDLLDASVGFAAINSLLEPDSRLRDGNAFDLVMAHGEGRDVTVVGHFPFVDRLRERARNLWVLELAPGEGDLPSSEATRVIPRSDVIAMTGTTFVNHTVDGLLDLARGKFVVVLGPTTPLAPVLLDHGVSALGGCIVTDPDAILRHISEGACFRHAPGVRFVTLTRA
jgi:uncharacterized protein (DUF4213/DUF364 family)